MKQRQVTAWVVGSLLLAACGGNFEDVRPGSIEIRWAIGGATCSTVGVSTVRISLFDQNGLYTTESSACQLGSANVTDVPPGIYSIQVDGFRAGSDFPTYSGSVLQLEVRDGTITVAPTIEMSEVPGGLDVTWRFQSGELCGFAGVDTVVLNVWDGHANRIYEASLPCDPFAARVKAEEEQPNRVLYDTARGIVVTDLYAGQYTLRAFAMKAGEDLHPQYWAEARPVVTHSKLTPVDLVLQSCQITGADGSSAPVGICF